MPAGSVPLTSPRRVPPRRVPALPAGVELYRLGADGTIELTSSDGTRRLDRDPELLRFIDDGQRAAT